MDNKSDMEDMEIFREKFKKWMKERKISRSFIAEQCLVSKRTIDRWMTRGEVIPLLKIRILEGLMSGSPSSTVDNVPTQVIIDFTPEQYIVVKAEAERRGLTVEEWAAEVLHSLAKVTVRVRV